MWQKTAIDNNTWTNGMAVLPIKLFIKTENWIWPTGSRLMSLALKNKVQGIWLWHYDTFVLKEIILWYSYKKSVAFTIGMLVRTLRTPLEKDPEWKFILVLHGKKYFLPMRNVSVFSLEDCKSCNWWCLQEIQKNWYIHFFKMFSGQVIYMLPRNSF